MLASITVTKIVPVPVLEPVSVATMRRVKSELVSLLRDVVTDIMPKCENMHINYKQQISEVNNQSTKNE